MDESSAEKALERMEGILFLRRDDSAAFGAIGGGGFHAFGFDALKEN